MHKAALTIIAILFAVGFAAGQSTNSAAPADGLALLQHVAQHYAAAKSYRIEALEERTNQNEYENCLQKTRFAAAEGEGNRYRYEGQAPYGGALKIADGKTVWTYRKVSNHYTEKPIPPTDSKVNNVMGMSESAMFNAEQLRKSLANLATQYKSATLLADQTISVNGRKLRAAVVHVETKDLKRAAGFTVERTYWIDKTSNTIVRTAEKSRSYMLVEDGKVALDSYVVTNYTVTELDGAIPDSFFQFKPPAEARLVQEFPDPTKGSFGPSLVGEQMPDLKLKSADGHELALSSYRGKPVLLDVWATWCTPCVKAMPQFATILDEAKDKGLVGISIDQDEEAKTATDFMAKKGYTWPNFHDGEGLVEKTLGPSGVPRTMLIDPQGQVVFDRAASSDEDLRAAIARLGPEYASLAPKPKAIPCMAQK